MSSIEWSVPAGATYAELGAEELQTLGLINGLVQAEPSRVERTDR
jgi:hypothetical protein